VRGGCHHCHENSPNFKGSMSVRLKRGGPCTHRIANLSDCFKSLNFEPIPVKPPQRPPSKGGSLRTSMDAKRTRIRGLNVCNSGGFLTLHFRVPPNMPPLLIILSPREIAGRRLNPVAPSFAVVANVLFRPHQRPELAWSRGLYILWMRYKSRFPTR
jgi:hypothetical protein